MDGDHFDGGDGGFEAFVAGFDAGAVEGLLEGLAGEDAEGMGDAGLLLGLADSASYLGVDGLVVGGFAAEEAAEGDDGVVLLRLGEGAGGGGDLPGAGDADDLDIGLGCAAAEQAVEGALEQAVGDDGVPAGGDDGEGHARRRRGRLRWRRGGCGGGSRTARSPALSHQRCRWRA